MEVRLATIKKMLKGGDLIKVKSGFTRCDTLVNKRKEVTDVDKQLVWGILTGTIISRMGRS